MGNVPSLGWRIRGRRRWVFYAVTLTAMCLVVALLLSSSGSSATGYGLSTTGANDGVSEVVASCNAHQVPCPASQLELMPPFGGDSPGAVAFRAFRTQVLSPSGKGGYLRLWIPYDTLSSWNPSINGGRGGCDWSAYAFGPPAHFNAVNGETLFDQLVWNIQGAIALKLTPEIVISAGSGEGVPSYPDPGYGDGRNLFAGTTTAGDDYLCGVLGVMGWLRAELGARAPTHWEVFNEPNAYGPYQGYLHNGCAAHDSCGTPPKGADYNHAGYLCGSRYAACGPLEAAELWELAQSVVSDQGWRDERVAALSMTNPESSFGMQYIEQLRALSSCAAGFTALRGGQPKSCSTASRFPRYWAVHDYDDPTSGGTADLQSLENTLSNLAGKPHLAGPGALSVWVTEAGIELASPTPADLNRRGCSVAGAAQRASLGACVNDNPANQQRGALAWRSLLNVKAHDVQTTQVYWFEFQLIDSWDSALVDSGGKPRQSFCALVSGFSCDGNPTAYLLRDG